MVNAVTIATLNRSSTCPEEVSEPRLSGLPIAGGRSQKLGTLSSTGNHHAAAAAAAAAVAAVQVTPMSRIIMIINDWNMLSNKQR